MAVRWLPGLRRAVPSAPLDERCVFSCDPQCRQACAVASNRIGPVPTRWDSMVGGGVMRPDVRRWFERRTTTSADWPLADVVAAKAATRVSVVLPARDEEATVGDVVAAIRRDLMSRVPLVDELVVMDSGSRDATARVAAAAGAVVVHRDDVLPHLGSVEGKGEVLWKSLHVTSGDVVVFVDADLQEFSSSFVTGLLGPLLADAEIGFVKATYDRPLAVGGEVAPTGGGRVTELVARPLLNLYWPALAGFVQPLS